MFNKWKFQEWQYKQEFCLNTEIALSYHFLTKPVSHDRVTTESHDPMRMLWSIHSFTGTFKTAHRYVSQTRLSIRQNSYCCSHGRRTAQSMGARLLHQWSPTRVSCSPRDVPGQGELKMWSREQTHRGCTLYPKNFWHQASKGAESITKRESSQ